MRRLLRVSRPRFWMYVFGPYIVGALCGSNTPREFFAPLNLFFALFFLFPANLLIYGINDIYDYETDALNAKKRGYESLIPPDERREIGAAIAFFCTPILFAIPFIFWKSLLALIAFLFFSIFYSATPIRAKARPIVDSIFNVLYVFPGVMAYFLSGSNRFSWPLFLGAWAWAMAMHAYSAVPDISADKEAGVPTVATLLGLEITLYFCAGLYLFSAISASPALTWLSVALGILYLGMMVASLREGTQEGVMKIYRFFPAINTAAGAAIFWFILWSKTVFWPNF